MINFQRLHYFCVMVEEGGIHKAARRLGLSQPPLSIALRELEKEVGCQLVFRSGRNWIVTESGQRLYEEGRAILAQTNSLAARIAQTPPELRGEVRAGFSTSCVSMFQKVIPRMASGHPSVTCHAMFTDSERLADNVRQRLIDFAVLYLPVAPDEFNVSPLRGQRLASLFSPLLAAPPSGELSLAQVCENPLLLPRRWKGGGIYSIFVEAVQRLKIRPRIVCLTQSTYLLRDILKNVAAVAILPQSEAGGEASPPMQVRLVRELSTPLTPALVTLKNTFLSHAAHGFMSMLLEEYGEE